MLVVRETGPDTFVELHPVTDGRPTTIAVTTVAGEEATTVIHTWQIVEHWTNAELAGIGLYRVPPTAPPDGQIVTGYGFARIDDVVTQALMVAPPSQADLLAYAAKVRWQKEAGGIVVDGVPIPTDERTQGVLTAAYASAMADAAFQVPDWKFGPGVYTTLTNAQVIAIANAVRAHVQGCFTRNKQVDADITAGALTTFAAIEAAFAAA